MTGRRPTRAAAGPLALVVVLGIVVAALTALPPAAGAATAPRTATNVDGHKGSRPVGLSARSSTDLAAKASAETTVVLLVVERDVPHSPRPPLPSSAAFNASQKHAIRAAPTETHETHVLAVIVVPAQGPRAPPCAYEPASRFTDAGGDPVNEGDPSGLYSYQFSWYIGQVSAAGNAVAELQPEFQAFAMLAHNLKLIFPFSTGQCTEVILGEHCLFLPGIGNDYLHVSAVTDNSFTLTVDHWCQSPSWACVAGDPKGSTITFTVGVFPDEFLPSSWLTSIGCAGDTSGDFLYLTQTANAPNADVVTNIGAPIGAFFTWQQLAKNFAKLLGFDPNTVALLEGGGFSYGLPF